MLRATCYGRFSTVIKHQNTNEGVCFGRMVMYYDLHNVD